MSKNHINVNHDMDTFVYGMFNNYLINCHHIELCQGKKEIYLFTDDLNDDEYKEIKNGVKKKLSLSSNFENISLMIYDKENELYYIVINFKNVSVKKFVQHKITLAYESLEINYDNVVDKYMIDAVNQIKNELDSHQSDSQKITAFSDEDKVLRFTTKGNMFCLTTIR